MIGPDRFRDASLALRRFGLGARPGDVDHVAEDPRGFVAEQARRAASGVLPAQRPATAELLTFATDFLRAEQRARQMAAQEARQGGAAQPMPGAPPSPNALGPQPQPAGPNAMAAPPASQPTPQPVNAIARIYADEVMARATNAIVTDKPFLERLVMFWSNFFCVAANKGPLVRAIAGSYEREVVRPHVLGRFATMLKAATQHPAMLAYLDNDRSVGPNSVRGMRRNLGLNENLARETLELHSLGVDGGYTQADVTELARIITGWRVAGRPDAAPFGQFFFDAAAHEPGTFILLGRPYPETGLAQGEAALADLARHPATARTVARRLAAHFVADAASPALVEKLERTFRDTDGDLRAVSVALASSDEAWTPEPVKFLPPYDFRIAAYRLLGRLPTPQEFLRGDVDFGQPIWVVPSPKGWSDGDGDWVAPDALLERLDWANQLAKQEAGTRDVVALADDAFGAALSRDCAAAIKRAESREQALALLLASSEFQMR